MIGRLRTLWLFYRRHLRSQPLRELMAVLGVAAGVALLFAVQVAHRSITGSFEAVARGVAGDATVEVAARGPRGISQRTARLVEGTRGVRAAAPILSVPIVAIGPAGRRELTLVGATEQVGALHGRLSTAFQRAGRRTRRGLLLLTGPTAQQLGVGVGGKVTVLVAGRREAMTVGAELGHSAIGAAAASPIAAAPLAIVQSVSGLRGRVSRILVEPAQGGEAGVPRRLARRLGSRVDVRPVSTEARLLSGAASTESEVTLLFSVISLVAGVILAYNALLLASGERRRFVTYLIETGTPDWLVISSLAFDALVLGLAGCAVGLAAGEAISVVALTGVPGYLAAAFPVSGGQVVSAQTVLIALAGGMAAAFAAAVLPALTILRGGASSQPEAVGGALSFTRRLRPSEGAVFAVGLALAAGATATALAAPGTTVAALVGLAAGMVICLPMVGRGLTALARRIAQQVRDPAARLAVAELRGAPTRAVALLATGAIAAFLMVVIGGSVSDVQRAVRAGAGGLLSGAQLWVRPPGAQNVYTTQAFASDDVAKRLQALPEVASLKQWRDTFLDLPGRRVWVVGVPREQRRQIVPSQLIEGSLAVADRQIREGGWAAVSQTIAAARHLRIGRPFTVPTPAGPARLRVAAIVANYGWLSGAIVMGADQEAKLWGGGASELAVSLAPGVSVAAGRRAVRKAMGGALALQSTRQRRAEVASVLGSTLSRLNEITAIVIVTAIASVVALMMAAVWQGRGRLDSLISIGMSFAQLARMIFYQSGAALLAGCLIGAGGGLLGQYLIDQWLKQSTGSPVAFAPAWPLGLMTIAVALAVSLIAATVATVRVTAFQPRTAFSGG